MNVVATVAGSISLGIIVDDTIHFMARFQASHRESGEAEQAMRETLVHAGPPARALPRSLQPHWQRSVAVEARTEPLRVRPLCARLARVVAFAAASAVALVSTRARAGQWSFGGDTSADARTFASSPAYAGQARGDAVSLRAEPELAWTSESGHHAVALRPLYRLDPIDGRRSHADLRQARWDFTGEHLTLGAGVGTFAWGRDNVSRSNAERSEPRPPTGRGFA
jgi:hypothetical protein